MKVAIAQINSSMSNILFNEKKILKYITKAYKQGAQLIIFPEMTLCAYSPLDLLKQKSFLNQNQSAIKRIHKQIPKDTAVLLGGIEHKASLYNVTFFLQKNKPIQSFAKEYLANNDVFNEARYFKKGTLKNNFVVFQNTLIQILICEELWQKPDLISFSYKKNPDIIVVLNASPFYINKHKKRIQVAQKWTQKYHCPLFYINAVGGQEEIIFDGGSFSLNSSGKTTYQMPFFKEALGLSDILTNNISTDKIQSQNIISQIITKSKVEQMTQALVFGLKEFVEKNNFKKIHLGLSGGIDSALTATLACKALKPENVSLFFLPNIFTSKLSKNLVIKMSKHLNCSLVTQDIKDLYFYFFKLKSLNLKKSNPNSDITKQNIQARIRSLFLMAIANSCPYSLLLCTSNKSELALGYGTLYGDLAGGLLPLGDLLKTEVYQLAHHLNIPSAIINREASAELKKNQKDTDDLPAYEILDPVLHRLIEKSQTPQTLFEKKIFNLIIKSEFKRKQSAPILKIKQRGFDRGWNIPLSIKKLNFK